MKRILAVLMVLALLVTLTGCGSSSIVGKWKATNSDSDEMKLFIALGELTMEFQKNGKGSMTMSAMGESQTEEFEYKADGKKLTIEGDTTDYSVEKDTLTLTLDGVKVVFKKVK